VMTQETLYYLRLTSRALFEYASDEREVLYKQFGKLLLARVFLNVAN
jgi:hypothetical protein